MGNKLNSIHKELSPIEKLDNRRSARKIIELANKIRNDSFSQYAYLDDEGNSQIFYAESNNYIEEFIKLTADSFPKDEEVHCLVLKNELVAQQSGFGDFYELIKSTKYYSERYNQQSTEILSDDIKKLGKIPLLIYRWVNLYSNIHDSKLSIDKYIPQEVYGKINVYNLTKLRESMKSVKADNLSTFIDGTFSLAKQKNDVFSIIKSNIGLTFDCDLNTIREYLLEELYEGESDEKIEEAKEKIDALLSLDFKVLLCWYNFITRNIAERIQFHTFHGTKGLEYKNVIIILTNDFHRKSDYFHYYFENYNDLEAYNNEEFLKRRNLLYVAVTRTKSNLRMLYIDPNYDSIKQTFEEIFGEVTKWDNN